MCQAKPASAMMVIQKEIELLQRGIVYTTGPGWYTYQDRKRQVEERKSELRFLYHENKSRIHESSPFGQDVTKLISSFLWG